MIPVALGLTVVKGIRASTGDRDDFYAAWAHLSATLAFLGLGRKKLKRNHRPARGAPRGVKGSNKLHKRLRCLIVTKNPIGEFWIEWSAGHPALRPC